jgi:hypothetical protein
MALPPIRRRGRRHHGTRALAMAARNTTPERVPRGSVPRWCGTVRHVPADQESGQPHFSGKAKRRCA